MSGKAIYPLLVSATIALGACGSKENERLKAENDSLLTELNTRQNMMVVMRDVKGLIDSIDANRKVLRSDLQEGTSYDNFSTRLKDINSYVKKTQEKIKSIENAMKSAKRESSAYLMMVDALKGELSIRVKEVEELEASVAKYQEENKGLVNTVKLQEAEMADMQTKIEAKQQELSLLEAKVNELVENFKVSEAEAYYARARAVEEAARRTKLARGKKKETYREALELYKKALSLGKKEAKQNITELEKKIN